MPKRSSLDPHVHPAAAFGSELRQARERAGFKSRAALAKAMGYTLTTIGKAESGHALPSDTVFTAWMEACKAPPDHRDKLQADLAYVRTLLGVPTWFRPWMELEKEADSIRIWCPMLMPGLLQIQDYVRALYSQAGVDEGEAKERIKARLELQLLLERGRHPRLTVLIDESVLYRLVGTPETMVRQLGHLMQMAQRRYVSI